ncbi:fasciclin domain-containing protein, partial [Sphingomonas bacterium]|uniref:fasciclin domain-containing protein n=1 Tax=Sphingomonas bacterium TaxID=1895847 RepID=UPI001C2D7AA9
DRLTAGRGPVTLLAPTDAAFARLPAGTVEALLLPGNRPSLLHLLRFWTVPGALYTKTPATSDARVPTLEGESLRVVAADGATVALVDAYRRTATVVAETQAADGRLVTVDGIVAPRSIEPGARPGAGR